MRRSGRQACKGAGQCAAYVQNSVRHLHRNRDVWPDVIMELPRKVPSEILKFKKMPLDRVISGFHQRLLVCPMLLPECSQHNQDPRSSDKGRVAALKRIAAATAVLCLSIASFAPSVHAREDTSTLFNMKCAGLISMLG
jgi:hypothetical protein